MQDPDHIVNWRRLDARLTTSGQPDETGLAAIAALGVRHVVNLALHTHPKALPDEAASVAALGMAYVHIPVDFDAPTEADFARYIEAVAEVGGARLHVHCIMNYRVSAFIYRHRLERLGWEEGVARADMERIWRPGGVWAAFIGDVERQAAAHCFPGRDYKI